VTEPGGSDAQVVVVGGGHAGTALVGLLRQQGHRGPITLFGDEVDYPYHRPPLSKKFADGQLEQWLRPPEFYRDQDIAVRLGEQITRIDRPGRRLHTASGETCGYDYLVLATGARPRTIPVPGADLAGVLALRTLADARLLRKCVAEGRTLVIVGGGYIGLEVAAVARANGVAVTIVERESRVLARLGSPRLSEILTEHHRGHDVDIVTDAKVARLDGRDNEVRRAVLDDGTSLDCGAVLVAVGAVPRDELAAAAGLRCAKGIVVDQRTRTSDPHILAIGDATRRPVTPTNAVMRLESIPSATEQAGQAAAVITGRAEPTPEVPWFWSDQYDLRLKIAGLVPGNPVTVTRGDPASGRFALFHLDSARQGGAVAAVESANSAADFMAGKKLIGAARSVDPDRLADPSIPLRDIVAP
jgi:3-phenylpropionate/trans-cinnamate dioxygenase ferredoxin reductase subunit